MNKRNLNESLAAMNTVLGSLLQTLQGKTGLAGAQARYACGAMAADGGALLNTWSVQFWAEYAACFEACQQAGATFAAMDKVRAVAEALVVSSKAAIAVKNFSVRMALAEQARILAATTFVSREDLDNYADQINASFERAELVAADNLDNVAYRSLIAIHAAVSNDIATRSRPLPRMTTYVLATPTSALSLAQRLYLDGARADELVAENKPIHPLFMARTGRALSA